MTASFVDASTLCEKVDHAGLIATLDSDAAQIFGYLRAPNQSASALARLETVTELDRELYDHAVRRYMIPARRRRWIKGVAGRVIYPLALRG